MEIMFQKEANVHYKVKQLVKQVVWYNLPTQQFHASLNIIYME